MVTFTGMKDISRAKNYNNLGVDDEVVEKNIEKIQEELGFNKTVPMVLSADDQNDLDTKGDRFLSWYQEELQELYDGDR